MKILFVSGNLCNGGAQRVIANVSSCLAEKGHEVHLLLFSRNEKEYPISEKVQITAMGQNFEEYSAMSGLSRIVYIRKYLKDLKPEVAVGFLEGGYAIYLSSFGMKFKKVASARISPRFIMTDRSLRSTINRRWFYHADGVVLQTSDQMELVPPKLQKKSVVIGNPVSEKALEIGCEEYCKDCRRLVMAGRITEQKNYPMAFEAIKIVKERYPDIHLDIFGKGILQESLENKIQEMNLSENVSLKGWTQDTLGEYIKHDLYLMTSDYEGMPNALMEAMAVGLPCISTDCETGPSSLVIQGENGYLVPVGDAKALAEKIIAFIEMPVEERKTIAQRARKDMRENFNVDAISQKWEKFFHELIGESYELSV